MPTYRKGPFLPTYLTGSFMARRQGLLAKGLRRQVAALSRERGELTAQVAQLTATVGLYRGWIDQAPVGFHFIDANGTLREVNQRWLDLLGYTAEEKPSIVDQKTIFDFIHPDDVADARARFAVRLSDPGANLPEVERRYITKDGRIIYVKTYNTVFKDANGHTLVQTSFQDITTIKRAQEQLLEREKLAAISQFVMFISHTYKNLLSKVVFYIEQIKELDRKIFEKIATIRGAQISARPLERETILDLQRLQEEREQLIDQLEAVNAQMNDEASRLQKYARRGKDEQIIIGVRGQIEELTRLMSATAREANVHLRVNLNQLDEACGLLISEIGFQDMLRNLITNAIEAFDPPSTSANGRDILVNAVIERGQLKVTILDTGCGMSPARLQELQAPVIVSTKPNGHGLGLKEVQTIVAAAGGKFKINSGLGQGTIVTLTFPITKYIPPAKVETTPQIIQLTPAEAAKINVLVVDDDPVLTTLITRIMETLGFNCSSATNGKDALTTIHSGGIPFHLIVTDEGMSEMSGHELIEEIARTVTPLPRIVMNSAFDEPTDPSNPIRQALDRTRALYYRKPMKIPDFMAFLTGLAHEILNPK